MCSQACVYNLVLTWACNRVTRVAVQVGENRFKMRRLNTSRVGGFPYVTWDVIPSSDAGGEERVVVKGGPTGDVWDIISVSGVISGF